MKKLILKDVEHDTKIGAQCGQIEPNITEDCYLMENGQIVGFYLRDLTKYDKDLPKILALANAELRSSRVPKSEMRRSSGVAHSENDVRQYSTIIGSVPPKPNMRRNYATMSSVHNVASAQHFIKAMLIACKKSEAIIKRLAPEMYDEQVRLIKENVPEKWRFGKLFTSSISNYNIPAAFHRDTGNIIGCVNVIITKRKDSIGGNLHVPDYGATFDSCDNSMIVYPAWKNVHGVTPIEPMKKDGYRNTLIFYPLKAFKGLE